MRKKTFGRMISPVKQAASLVAAVLLIAGCAAPGSSAKTSPSAHASSSSSGSPSPTSSGPASPAPLTGVFALLLTTTSADNYTVSIGGQQKDPKKAGKSSSTTFGSNAKTTSLTTVSRESVRSCHNARESSIEHELGPFADFGGGELAAGTCLHRKRKRCVGDISHRESEI